MKIFSADQIKAWDQFTIREESIPSIELMERACRAFTHWFFERYDAAHKVGVICGTGNNGGDGLGIARLLHDWGYAVKVWIVNGGVKESADYKINRKRLPEAVSVIEIKDSMSPELFSDRTILIDALFGSGLTRPLEGIYSHVIEQVNQSKAIRLAVDVPSGIFVDRHSEGTRIRAHQTVTFQCPKLAFMQPENYPYVGEWHVIDIGLSKKFLKETEVAYSIVDLKSVKKLIKPRNKFDHKGTYGHALLIAGSTGKMGACVLAARAAMRSGVGLVTAHVPQSGYPIIQVAVPEVMATQDTSDHYFTEREVESFFSAIGIGPGLGQQEETGLALQKFLQQVQVPLVLDADALNLLASDSRLIDQVPPGSILTPHPGEFKRLVGSWTHDFEKLEKLKKFSSQTQSIVVLKGAYTAIASPDGEITFNATGNPGMATGGSGDVLTGLLTGLLAQGYSSLHAAVLGVYLHGLAGDLAAHEKGLNSLIAGDIVDFLPAAFRKIE